MWQGGKMKKPGIPVDEDARIAILEESGIIYSPAEERFDRITRLAKRIFDVPIAVVSLVTANTQWFKSCQGLTVSETTREVSFCGHAILGEDTFIIPDTHKDKNFSDNPLVVNEPHIRFYAGHPVRLNSVKLGTLCIIDQRPRRFQADDFDTLKSLALWVENELKLSLYTASQKELMERMGTLKRKVLIDTVTGCWNQRGLDKLLYNELERSHRENKPVSMLLVDVEAVVQSQKSISGQTQDNIIKEVAQSIRGAIRSHDIVGKLGGYQFLIFLSNCEKDMCEVLTQRILRNIAIKRFKTEDETIQLAARIGMTSNQSTDIWSPTLLWDTAKNALEIALNMDASNTSHFLVPEISNA